MRPLLASCIVAALASSTAAVRADPAAPDAITTAPPDASPAFAPKPWLYLDDPTTPAPWHVTAFSRATYTGTGGSPTRPFGADTAHPGGVLEAGAEVGLTPWLSLAASGYGSTLAPTDNGSLGAMVGLRVAPFAETWRTTHLVLSGGALRLLSGGGGAWGRVSLTQDVGRARFGGMVHGEHVFAQGHDGLDVMVTAGASYEVAGPVRAGIEYVAQDLEGAVDPEEAEGGMRHFVGPTASVELLEKRLSLVGGPAFGLSPGSPLLLGRLSVAYAF